MALVTSSEMFAKALKSDYAVGAFNVNNMEILQGIAEAAEETRSPSLHISPSSLKLQYWIPVLTSVSTWITVRILTSAKNALMTVSLP